MCVICIIHTPKIDLQKLDKYDYRQYRVCSNDFAVYVGKYITQS